jgi:hypothetical protein
MLHESPPTATDREAAVEAALAGLAEDDATALLRTLLLHGERGRRPD